MIPVRGGTNRLDVRQDFENSVDLVGSTTLPGLFYGVVLSLYCLCVCSLYQSRSQKPHLRQHIIFSLVHATILTILATIYLALLTRASQISYIDNKDYPGGPAVFKQDVLHSIPIYFLCITMSFILGVLTLVVQIWRLWVIWSGTRYARTIKIISIVLFSAFIAFGTTSITIWSLPKNPLSSAASAVVTIGSYALGFANTVFVTLLVSMRLIIVRRRHLKLMGPSEVTQQYIDIVTVLIESYALECVWSIVTIVLVSANYNPVNMLFNQCENLVRIIAYFLVLYRISRGSAWTPQTEQHMTSLCWNREISSSSTQTVTEHV
ncbi:hypothetical protein NP233_g7162 [Leucocoprinus birnbaumii]|uniref:Uncharacterized protein n=1 Tax=Leucocoprinus birnbaumii TaxID=56174 RepID=A0AAD5YQ95_9AGAR|nr:hypothetical protein NP233_g7162 [Leucocoprinus birnbaumii]